MALTPEEALARYENHRVDSRLLVSSRKVSTGLIPDPWLDKAVNKAVEHVTEKVNEAFEQYISKVVGVNQAKAWLYLLPNADKSVVLSFNNKPPLVWKVPVLTDWLSQSWDEDDVHDLDIKYETYHLSGEWFGPESPITQPWKGLAGLVSGKGPTGLVSA